MCQCLQVLVLFKIIMFHKEHHFKLSSKALLRHAESLFLTSILFLSYSCALFKRRRLEEILDDEKGLSMLRRWLKTKNYFLRPKHAECIVASVNVMWTYTYKKLSKNGCTSDLLVVFYSLWKPLNSLHILEPFLKLK